VDRLGSPAPLPLPARQDAEEARSDGLPSRRAPGLAAQNTSRLPELHNLGKNRESEISLFDWQRNLPTGGAIGERQWEATQIP
jgi:hypothetical protein